MEYLVIKEEFKSSGIFSWNILSSRPGHQKYLRQTDLLFSYPSTMVFLILKFVASVLLIVIPGDEGKALLLSVILFLSLLFFYRNIFGNDGSDQMNHIIITALLLAYATKNTSARNICIFFVALQSVTAYVVAGIAKIVSAQWRSGIALTGIMGTKTYGHVRIARLLRQLPRSLHRAVAWGIILFETSFIFVILLPSPWFYIFLIGGCLFHLYNAVVMGLNNFTWSFLATYPCIIYVNGMINR
jgi:hypothetical protein